MVCILACCLAGQAIAKDIVGHSDERSSWLIGTPVDEVPLFGYKKLPIGGTGWKVVFDNARMVSIDENEIKASVTLGFQDGVLGFIQIEMLDKDNSYRRLVKHLLKKYDDNDNELVGSTQVYNTWLDANGNALLAERVLGDDNRVRSRLLYLSAGLYLQLSSGEAPSWQTELFSSSPPR